tara:strand:- start:15 stop:377 length:363 start_codon:yes stop_codon:yes gene_type:complete
MTHRSKLGTLFLGGLMAGLMTCFVFIETAEAKPPGPMTKMGRGLKNIAIAFFDIPATVGRAAHEDHVVYAITGGIFEGIGNGMFRAVSGFVEIIGSPFPRYDIPLYDRRLGESPLGRYKQ